MFLKDNEARRRPLFNPHVCVKLTSRNDMMACDIFRISWDTFSHVHWLGAGSERDSLFAKQEHNVCANSKQM